MEHGVMIVEACAREEREEGARGEDHQENQAEEIQTGLSGLVRPDYPAPGKSTSFGRGVQHAVVGPDFSNNPARIIRPHADRIIRPVQTGLSGLKIPVRVCFESLSPERFVSVFWSPQPPL